MNTSVLTKEIDLLPPEEKREVLDFVAFLRSRCRPAEKLRKGVLSKESFVGMWRGRDDMSDSSGWVRRVRRDEWK